MAWEAAALHEQVRPCVMRVRAQVEVRPRGACGSGDADALASTAGAALNVLHGQATDGCACIECACARGGGDADALASAAGAALNVLHEQARQVDVHLYECACACKHTRTSGLCPIKGADASRRDTFATLTRISNLFVSAGLASSSSSCCRPQAQPNQCSGVLLPAAIRSRGFKGRFCCKRCSQRHTQSGNWKARAEGRLYRWDTI